jgi:hypothetical protein
MEEETPKLKKYDINFNEKRALADAPVPSGVACSDFVEEDTEVEEPFLSTDSKGEVVIKKHTVIQKIKKGTPCPGEMMIDQPAIHHPEHPQVQKAKCNVCGWRGWV